MTEPITQVDGYEPVRAPDGLTPAAWKIALKEKYPEPAEGTCREVPAELRQQLELAEQAHAYWQTQVSLVKSKIREALGGAETATIDGEPFRIRKLVPYKTHTVVAGFRDQLMAPAKDEDNL